MHNTPSKYYDDKIPIEQVLYGQFIKYKSLFSMVAREFEGSNANTVNVFIDLHQFFLPAFRCLKVKNYYTMTAIAINYCAHIRSYFKGSHNVESNIILVHSLNMSSNNTKFIAEYNSKYSARMNYNTKMMETLQDNLQMLRLLVKYIPNTYLKEGTVEPAVIIKNLIATDFNNGVPNIVISSSEYMYQLPYYSPNTVVFRKKNVVAQSGGFEDASFSYNSITAPLYFIQDTKGTIKGDISTPPYAISVLMCLSGLSGRSVSSIFNITTAAKITRFIPSEAILAGDIEYIYGAIQMCLDKSKTKNKIEFDEFVNRYKAIDIRFQEAMYNMLTEASDKRYLESLIDPEALKTINDKWFKEVPLDLQRL